MLAILFIAMWDFLLGNWQSILNAGLLIAGALGWKKAGVFKQALQVVVHGVDMAANTTSHKMGASHKETGSVKNYVYRAAINTGSKAVQSAIDSFTEKKRQ